MVVCSLCTVLPVLLARQVLLSRRTAGQASGMGKFPAQKAGCSEALTADAWQSGLWPQSRKQRMHALLEESTPAAHSAARPPASPLRSSNLLLDHWGRCRLELNRLLVLMLLLAAASLQGQLLWSRSPVGNLR